MGDPDALPVEVRGGLTKQSYSNGIQGGGLQLRSKKQNAQYFRP